MEQIGCSYFLRHYCVIVFLKEFIKTILFFFKQFKNSVDKYLQLPFGQSALILLSIYFSNSSVNSLNFLDNNNDEWKMMKY